VTKPPESMQNDLQAWKISLAKARSLHQYQDTR
jgi:hypothetical protein